MVKTPRIHKQCPDTAVFSSRTDAAFPSRKFSQFSFFNGQLFSPRATQKSTPTRNFPFILLFRKGYLPKDKFSLDTTTMLRGGWGGWKMEDHPVYVIFSKNTFWYQIECLRTTTFACSNNYEKYC